MTQLGAVVATLRRTLGDTLLGAYLFGSSTLGGLQPRSDLDLLAVTSRPLTAAERDALTGALRASGERPVELTVVTQAAVNPWRYPPLVDYQYGEWIEGEIPPPARDPDLAILVTMALRADHPLLGPAPAALLAPVPREDVLDAVRRGAEPLLGDLDTDATNVLLTLARIVHTLETGELVSKRVAADRILERDPDEALAHARDVYVGRAAERWDAHDPRVVAKRLLARVRLTAGA